MAWFACQLCSANLFQNFQEGKRSGRIDPEFRNAPGFCPRRPPQCGTAFLNSSDLSEWLHRFYGRLEKCIRSAGKTMSIKFLVLGGGGILGLGGGGGGKCRSYFYEREDFSDYCQFYSHERRSTNCHYLYLCLLRPHTVSESMASNPELSEFLLLFGSH